MHCSTQSSNSKKRKYFTHEEDKILSSIMLNEEFTCWGNIASRFENRQPRQCRDRWMNYLAPWIKKGYWTQEEDAIIFEEVSTIGQKWATITKFLPGRSDNDIKNRWYTYLNKRNNPFPKKEKKDSIKSENIRTKQNKEKIDFGNEIESSFSFFCIT
jgi:hypothetical protein